MAAKKRRKSMRVGIELKGVGIIFFKGNQNALAGFMECIAMGLRPDRIEKEPKKSYKRSIVTKR